MGCGNQGNKKPSPGIVIVTQPKDPSVLQSDHLPSPIKETPSKDPSVVPSVYLASAIKVIEEIPPKDLSVVPSVYLASAIKVIEEIPPKDLSESKSFCKSNKPEEENSSVIEINKKEGWKDLSRIQSPKRGREPDKNSAKMLISSEIGLKTEELNSIEGFNFDFLSESSSSSKKLKSMIKEVLDEIESIKIN
jgi:hypothetical protein